MSLPSLHHTSRRFPRVSWTDDAGSHELIVQQRMLLGTAATVDVVVSDRTVSRVHAELDPTDRGLWIRDLHSRNGTFIDGANVTQVCVRDLARVSVGATVLKIDYAAGVEMPVELWPTDHFHRLVGASSVMRELFALLARISPTESSILIRGETGTGKEVVARTIHDASLRAGGPYVVVDCAALPENLLDAELFGHTKGAFTGAAAARAGAIESANGGTVFLDEIGELPVSMQPKLLRVVEQRAVRRIGDTAYRPVDVRFVCATHRDLLSMVARGDFREDLYFRLCVLPVTVPPLRNRREDIRPLVEHFLKGKTISEELLEELRQMRWRGNVRELRNVVDRVLALGESVVRQGHVNSVLSEDEVGTTAGHQVAHRTLPPPSLEQVPPAARPSVPRLPVLFDEGDEDDRSHTGTTPLRAMMKTPIEETTRGPISEPPMSITGELAAPYEQPPFEGDFRTFRERWMELGEREYLRRMLERHQRNVVTLAREAGVNRTYIYRIMRKHGLGNS